MQNLWAGALLQWVPVFFISQLGLQWSNSEKQGKQAKHPILPAKSNAEMIR
jgi:hypothetical protein